MFDIVRAAGWRRIVTLALVQLLRSAGSVGVASLLSAQLNATLAAISAGDASVLARTTAGCCLYALLLGLVTLVSERLKASYVRVVMLGVRRDVMRGVCESGPADGAGSSDALTLLGQNMQTLEADGVRNLVDIFDAVSQVVIACAALLVMDPLVAVASIAATALPTLLPRLFSSALESCQRSIVEATQSYNSRVRDAAQGAEVVRSFGAQGAIEDLHQTAAEKLEGRRAHLSQVTGLLMGTTNFVSISMQFLVMALAGCAAVAGSLSVGSIVAVTQLTGQVVGPASQLSSKLGRLRALRPILEQVEAAARVGEPQRRTEVSSSLELRHASFSYDGAPALRDVSVRLERGRAYAIVGRSGGGKSTLLRLLAGELAPEAGELLVDGRPCAAPDIAAIHQNVFLFDDTVRNNITLWGDFPEHEVDRAVEAAGLSGTVAALPQGLDTPVGEGGSRLSGGERQRVAIARALLHRKSVLLVDEATSALDARTAEQVEDTLLSLEDVLVVEVTHRLDPERAGRYEQVLELSDGRLREVGRRRGEK